MTMTIFYIKTLERKVTIALLLLLSGSNDRYAVGFSLWTKIPSQQRSLSLLTSHSHRQPTDYTRVLTASRERQNRKNTIERAASTQQTTGSRDSSTDVSFDQSDNDNLYTSFIASIKSRNLAGMKGSGDDGEIRVTLGNSPNLVAVTGETGTGKSLLLSKAVELLTGGKATPYFVQPSSLSLSQESERFASVEMEIRLSEPHLSFVRGLLQSVGIDPATLFRSIQNSETRSGLLTLKRTLSMGKAPPGQKARLKSLCEINGHATTLKALRYVASPLLTIVDASAAAAALSRPNSRMNIIDTGVPAPILTYAWACKRTYRECRERREQLEQVLENRVLPPSFSGESRNSDEDEVLQHWVEELDTFETRMVRFRDSVGASVSYDDASDVVNGHSILGVIRSFAQCSWRSDENSFSDSFYANLLEFRDVVKNLDAQVEAGKNACDALASLSNAESAITAIERARNSLYDAAGSGAGGTEDPLFVATEKSHDLLNKVEDALDACAKFMEDSNDGLMQVLNNLRSCINYSVDDIDEIITDWNALARKHSISSYSLPSCHNSLRCELDGDVEARQLLPEAIQREEKALADFETACTSLTHMRQHVGRCLSEAVTRRMPSLGLDGSSFNVTLRSSVRKCTDSSAYGSSSPLGLDSVDFLLMHGGNGDIEQSSIKESSEVDPAVQKSNRGGRIEVVGSSGEKARILLAIETELPGSVGASCGSFYGEAVEILASNEEDSLPVPCSPVAVLYDEIDAHVGGRAAVAVAKLLLDQTRERTELSNLSGIEKRRKSQVISITHSPSVAAIADKHIVFQKSSLNQYDSSLQDPPPPRNIHKCSSS